MSARSASSAPRWASWSWSSMPEKSWTPSPGNPRKPSDGAGPYARRGQGRVDRQALPVVRRAAVDVLLPPPAGGRAAGARRRYSAGDADPDDHRGGAGGRPADDHGAHPAGRRHPGEPQEDSPHPEAQPVAGPTAAAGPTATGPGLGLAGDAPERAVGDRYDPSPLRRRWLVPSHGAHRLLRPDDRRLAARPFGGRRRRSGRPRGGAADPEDRRGLGPAA